MSIYIYIYVLTDTGLSSNCMQKEQFRRPSRILKRLFSPLVTSLWSDGPVSLHSSCCLLLAFSRSVNDESDSIAQIAAIRPPELHDSPASETGTGLAESREQSGQSHWRVSVKELGRTERHVTCHGVTQVLHVRDSSAVGLFLQAMQMPSPSQGRS